MKLLTLLFAQIVHVCVSVLGFFLSGEGRNLGVGSGSNRLRDIGTFCTISLDQEEVFRTKVCDRSLR